MGGLTTGQFYYYGGIAIAGISLLVLIISIAVCEHRKKKFLKNMDKEAN